MRNVVSLITLTMGFALEPWRWFWKATWQLRQRELYLAMWPFKTKFLDKSRFK